jgi:hypothetical protein
MSSAISSSAAVVSGSSEQAISGKHVLRVDMSFTTGFDQRSVTSFNPASMLRSICPSI